MVQEKFSFSEALRARSGQREEPEETPRPVPSAAEPRFAPVPAQDSWSDFIDYKAPRPGRMAQEERSFPQLCEAVMEAFFRDWEERDSSRSALEIQKRAIIGYKKEKSFFKNRIADILREMNASDVSFPPWYESLTDAIYHENWGLAGLAEWFRPNYAFSSSAKIIGENMFFLEHGRMVLKPQKISKERKDQLIKAFLLLTPEERMDSYRKYRNKNYIFLQK